MSNRRKPRNPPAALTHVETFADPPAVAKVRSPADALAMIPYLMGFEPHESIVVVSLTGPRRRFGPMIRVDLVEADRAELLVGYLREAVEAHGYAAVLIAAFSTRPSEAAAVVPRLAESLDQAGVAVVEALRADGARWWSYTCDRGCCPPEGTPYDPSTSTMAALAVHAGMGKAASRDALAEQFARRDDAVRQTVNEVARDAVVPLMVDDAEDSIRVSRLVRSALGNDQIHSATLGRLLGAVQDLRARDVAWLLMTRDDAGRHFEVWRQVMNAADDDMLPPAGTLCAFAAWLSGRGALAATAADQVADVDPDYPFLELVGDILESGMSPDTWHDYRASLAPISEESPTAGVVADEAAV
jgi:Domain of unknown function (DUF4192)